MKKKRNRNGFINLSEELGKAINLHQNGSFPQAELVYKKIIRHSPRHPEALHMLGILYSQTGKLDTAIDLMRKSIKNSPGQPDYLFNLARACHSKGDFDSAVSVCQQYLGLVPDDPEALHWLGRFFHDKKDLDKAILYYRRALVKSHQRVDSLNSLGLAYFEKADFEKAVKCYEQALNFQPNDSVVLNNLAEAFRKLNKHEKAESCLRQAISAKDNYVLAINKRGAALFKEGRLAEAVGDFKKAVTFEPEFAEGHYNLGTVLTELQMFAEAANCFRKALSVKPEYASAHASLGRNYLVRGDLNNALASCKKALAINPYDWQALGVMSTIQDSSEDNSCLLKMERVFLHEEIGGAKKIDLAFSLGKGYAEIGDYDKSFFYISEGNSLARGSCDYSIREDEQLFKLIKKVYSEPYLSSHANKGNSDNTPIFILGMPRSGTSLVEQIIASHTDVYGAGELNDIRKIVFKLTGGQSLSEVFEKTPQSGFHFYERLAAEYLTNIRQHSVSAKFITDKLPQNFQFIGAIRLALPNARIINCVRSPMDNCFSIYKHAFQERHKYAYDLQELGQYFLLYEDLMRYWHNVFPGKIYDIKYEDLIDDQEGETRKLLRYCGLTWDERCLSFYKTSRDVTTLSLAQVRKPIYRDSVKLWEKFGKYLGPLESIISDKP